MQEGILESSRRLCLAPDPGRREKLNVRTGRGDFGAHLPDRSRLKLGHLKLSHLAYPQKYGVQLTETHLSPYFRSIRSMYFQ